MAAGRPSSVASCRRTSAGRRYGALPGRQPTRGRVRQGPCESNRHVMPSRPVSEARKGRPLSRVPIPHQNPQACPPLHAASFSARSHAKFPTDTCSVARRPATPVEQQRHASRPVVGVRPINYFFLLNKVKVRPIISRGFGRGGRGNPSARARPDYLLT